MTLAHTKDIRHQLDASGYAVAPEFLAEDSLASFKAIKTCRKDPAQDLQPHVGIVVGAEQSTLFAPIILLRKQYELMEAMGFSDARFFAGYFISKPPGSPRLHWHQDWWGWSDPVSYAKPAPIIYFMYYLTDTGHANGCLRVLPGSHVQHNELHSLLGDRSTHPARPLPADDAALSTRPDEVEISVSAGDLILRDGRLLHASHANFSNQDRDLLVLSFVPEWPRLSEQLQCAFDRKRPKIEHFWPTSRAAPVLERATTFRGTASPIRLQRTPNFNR